MSPENVEAQTDALPLCFSPAAPDTAGGPELHPEAVPGEAEVPGGPWGLPEALRPHQQPAEKDPPWGGGAGGRRRGGGRRGWSRGRGRRGGGGYRRAGTAEAAVPGQDEGEGAGDGLLLSKVRPGGAAALPAGALLPVSRMPVQPGYLPGTLPQPPGPSVQPGRQRLTVWTSLCRLFTKLGNATRGHAVDRDHQQESRCKFEGRVSSGVFVRRLAQRQRWIWETLILLLPQDQQGLWCQRSVAASLPFIMWETWKKKKEGKKNRREFWFAVDVVSLIFIVLVAHVNREQIQGFTDCRLPLMHLGLRGEYTLMICFCYLFMLLCGLWNTLCNIPWTVWRYSSSEVRSLPAGRLFLSLSLYLMSHVHSTGCFHFASRCCPLLGKELILKWPMCPNVLMQASI